MQGLPAALQVPCLRFQSRKGKAGSKFFAHPIYQSGSLFTANCFWFHTCNQFFQRYEDAQKKIDSTLADLDQIYFPSIIRLSKQQLNNLRKNSNFPSNLNLNWDTFFTSETFSSTNSQPLTFEDPSASSISNYKKKIVYSLDSFAEDERAIKAMKDEATRLLAKYDSDQLPRNRSVESSKLSRLTLDQYQSFLESDLSLESSLRSQRLNSLCVALSEEWRQINCLFRFENSLTKDILLKPLDEEKLLEFIEASCVLGSHGTRIYSQSHDDIPCKICNDGDYFDEDLIVFCAVSDFGE